MPISGKLEVTVKFNRLPTEVKTNANGWREFQLDCDGRLVSISLRPRMWSKLEVAATEYPFWIGSISGQMGQAVGKGFVLREPNLQIFERKPPADRPHPEPSPG